MASSSTAQKTFDIANDVKVLDSDKIFRYDADEQKAINNAHPWRSNPHHFKRVRISGVALIKMVMHARSGGQYEIMGLMQGKIDGDTFVVMDAFALPVEGTETRVNAANEANEYMVQYLETAQKVGRLENIVGWYHSHPGYGCWLSGIDVMTQMTNQTWTDPFLAIVIDPNRTISAGRVDIGAFRTYPENYTPPNAAASEYQSIPLSKIEDFGVHASRYYPLEIEHFKSSLDAQLLDLLWNKYWVMTLSQSPLVTNRAHTASQIADMTDKIGRAAASLNQRAAINVLAPEAAAYAAEKRSGKGKDAAAVVEGGIAAGDASGKAEETALAKAVRDSTKLSCECSHGLMSQLLKTMVFNEADSSSKVVLPLPHFD